jgi:hypothetical protein
LLAVSFYRCGREVYKLYGGVVPKLLPDVKYEVRLMNWFMNRRTAGFEIDIPATSDLR